MSLLPFLINELLEGNNSPFMGRDIYVRNIGTGLFNDEIFRPRSMLFSSPIYYDGGCLLPDRNLEAGDSGISTIESNNKEFKVNLDVQQFKPEELKVKEVGDYIVVEGKHEERSDQHGFISRQFTRHYKIPEDVDKATIVSNLSSDGVLTLKAPKLTSPGRSFREIPVIHINAPAVKPKESEKKVDKIAG